MEQKSILRRITDKLLGGLNMSWPAVIAFAAATAVLTAVFLILPIFDNTSFRDMGVTFEAWVFFAVIIMANCKTPLESALKTFVFFLISQPLIYLLQVPFSQMGWGLFGYYHYWFIWTLLTFPMAFVGWYIRKRNWLSLLILAPVLLFLAATSFATFRFSFAHFPRMLVKAVFCLGQVLLYLYAFTSRRSQRLLGLAAALAAGIVGLISTSRIDLNATMFLPDDPVLTEAAVVTVADPDAAEVTVAETGPDSMVRVHATHYGTTDVTIEDAGATYRYTLEIYEDEGGHGQIRWTPLE